MASETGKTSNENNKNAAALDLVNQQITRNTIEISRIQKKSSTRRLKRLPPGSLEQQTTKVGASYWELQYKAYKKNKETFYQLKNY